MDRTLDDLARLAEDYTARSLSGPFSAHVEQAIRLLEHRYEDMRRKGVSKEQLEKMQDDLDLMKRKLGRVRKAEEKALKEPRSVLYGERMLCFQLSIDLARFSIYFCFVITVQ